MPKCSQDRKMCRKSEGDALRTSSVVRNTRQVLGAKDAGQDVDRRCIKISLHASLKRQKVKLDAA